MKFKEWLELQEMWFGKGKATKSLFKPGPRDVKHKPSDAQANACGAGGGPGSCNNAMAAG